MKDYIIKRGDMFLINLGNNVGSEQNGYRPVMVLSNDVGNKFSPTITVAPITSKMKKKLPTHIELGTEIGMEKDSILLLEHFRTIDKTRIQEGSYIGRVSRELLKDINVGIEISLGLSDRTSKEVTKQADEVKFWDRYIKTLSEDVRSNKKQIDESIMKRKYELLKLENLCRLGRVNIKDFYIDNNGYGINGKNERLVAL